MGGRVVFDEFFFEFSRMYYYVVEYDFGHDGSISPFEGVVPGELFHVPEGGACCGGEAIGDDRF